jgi:hypothetical protein
VDIFEHTAAAPGGVMLIDLLGTNTMAAGGWLSLHAFWTTE